MNRADRRRSSKTSKALEKAKENYQFGLEEANRRNEAVNFNKFVEDHRLHATKKACEIMVGIMMIALERTFDFGTIRLNRALGAMRYQLECFAEGRLTYDDLKAFCLEKGVSIDDQFMI